MAVGLLIEEHINLELQAATHEDVIRELAGLITKTGYVANIETFVQATMEREALGPTGIGDGIAIPHGKCMAVSTPTIAFGRSSQGVEWKSMDNQPVHLVFLLAVPEDSPDNHHLRVLAALARKLVHEDFRKQLLESNDKEKLIALLDTIAL